MAEIPILFQDSDLVVVHKPAGLLVHRTGLDRLETQFAMQLVRDQIGVHVYPVHRLDRPTSGALLFAKSSEVARQLAEQFATRRVVKNYLAVVRGVAPAKIRVEHPLTEFEEPGKPAQDAVTEFECLDQIEFPVSVDRYPTSRYSLVRARPLTGRRHQIRRHLGHIAHPIIGDVTHGKGKHNRFFIERFGIRRLLLACTELRFYHPRQEQQITVRAPLAQDFADLLQALGWSGHAA